MNLERDVTVLVKWYTTQTRNIVRLEDLVILGGVACNGAEVEMKEGDQTWKGIIIATETENNAEDDVDDLPGDKNQDPNQEEHPGPSADEPQNSSLPDIHVAHKFQENQQRPLIGPPQAPPDIALMDFFGSTFQLPQIGKATVPNPPNWKRNIQKNKRDRGECYVSRTGKTVPARKVQEACGVTCPFRCTENFSEEDRQKVFDAYWQTGSFLRQRDFIGHHVKEKKPSKRRNHRNPEKSPQRARRKYYLPNGGDNIRVCFKFFCKTLDIKEKLVRYTLEKKNFCNFRVEEKKNTVPHNKTDEAALQEIRQHITSFPTVGSPQRRGTSGRQFLSADLNVTRMYNLYKATSERPQSLKVYRKVFNTEFNLGFQKPKKDN